MVDLRRAVSIALASGCAGGGAPCAVNADCPAGLSCTADRTCHAVDAAGGLDGLSDAMTCQPNNDGQIARDELVIVVPGMLDMRTSGQTAVDLSGTTWDFSGPLAGDQDVIVATAPVAGTWFAPTFPAGEFTTPITGQPDLLGVYVAHADSVAVLGAASKASGLTQTTLTYMPEVDALQLPLHVGQHWSGTSTVTGTADGVPVIFTDTYVEDVDTSGTVVTPYGRFPVLRTRLQLSHTVGLVTTTTVTYAFIAECFGTVATVTGQANDTSTPLTTAASVARLAP